MAASFALVKVGDTVILEGCAEVRGVVIQRVSERYMRVRWEDIAVPTVHLDTTLIKRVMHRDAQARLPAPGLLQSILMPARTSCS